MMLALILGLGWIAGAVLTTWLVLRCDDESWEWGTFAVDMLAWPLVLTLALYLFAATPRHDDWSC